MDPHHPAALVHWSAARHQDPATRASIRAIAASLQGIQPRYSKASFDCHLEFHGQHSARVDVILLMELAQLPEPPAEWFSLWKPAMERVSPQRAAIGLHETLRVILEYDCIPSSAPRLAGFGASLAALNEVLGPGCHGFVASLLAVMQEAGLCGEGLRRSMGHLMDGLGAPAVIGMMSGRPDQFLKVLFPVVPERRSSVRSLLSPAQLAYGAAGSPGSASTGAMERVIDQLESVVLCLPHGIPMNLSLDLDPGSGGVSERLCLEVFTQGLDACEREAVVATVLTPVPDDAGDGATQTQLNRNPWGQRWAGANGRGIRFAQHSSIKLMIAPDSVPRSKDYFHLQSRLQS